MEKSGCDTQKDGKKYSLTLPLPSTLQDWTHIHIQIWFLISES